MQTHNLNQIKSTKILHINTNDTGGAAIAAIRLHYLLLENGQDSKILFLKRSSKDKIKEAYYLKDSFKFKLIFSLIFKINNLYNRRFTFYKPSIYFNGIDSLFNIQNHWLFAWADVVHLHWVIKFLDWRKVFKYNKKFVWTCHDMNPFTGGNHYEIGYSNEFNIIAKNNLKRKAKIIKNVDITMVGPSAWITNLISQSIIFKNKKALTIRNPIDTNVFRVLSDIKGLKDKLEIDEKKKVILFVAENPNDGRKGFNLLLNALDNIENKENIHLLIIGRKLDLKTNISHTQLGTISDEELMCKLYNIADVFVIPSIEDNLPNTVSEALLCGTPVVGFNVGGIPEMVKNNINGNICDNKNKLYLSINNALESKFDALTIRNNIINKLDEIKLKDEFFKVY